MIKYYNRESLPCPQHKDLLWVENGAEVVQAPSIPFKLLFLLGFTKFTVWECPGDRMRYGIIAEYNLKTNIKKEL